MAKSRSCSAGLRPANYTSNRLNQYTQRDIPAFADILGIANPTASVTVNGNTAYSNDPVKKQVLTPAEDEILTQLLEGVVTSGTGTAAALPDIAVIGWAPCRSRKKAGSATFANWN